MLIDAAVGDGLVVQALGDHGDDLGLARGERLGRRRRWARRAGVGWSVPRSTTGRPRWIDSRAATSRAAGSALDSTPLTPLPRASSTSSGRAFHVQATSRPVVHDRAHGRQRQVLHAREGVVERQVGAARGDAARRGQHLHAVGVRREEPGEADRHQLALVGQGDAHGAPSSCHTFMSCRTQLGDHMPPKGGSGARGPLVGLEVVVEQRATPALHEGTTCRPHPRPGGTAASPAPAGWSSPERCSPGSTTRPRPAPTSRTRSSASTSSSPPRRPAATTAAASTPTTCARSPTWRWSRPCAATTRRWPPTSSATSCRASAASCGGGSVTPDGWCARRARSRSCRPGSRG